MKRILFVLLMLMFAVAVASPPSRVFTYVAGGIIQPAEVTSNEDALFGYLTRGVDTLADNAVETGDIQAGAVTSSKILDGTIVSADVSASAAIPYSKLSLTSGIVGGDLAGNIAISTSGAIATTGALSSTATTTTSGLSVTGAIKDKDGDWPSQDGQVLVSSKGLANWAAVPLPWTKVLWVTFVMATNAVRECYPAGVTITNIGVGGDTVNFPFNFSNTTYAVLATSGTAGTVAAYNFATKAVGSIDIYCDNTGGAATDALEITVYCFGN